MLEESRLVAAEAMVGRVRGLSDYGKLYGEKRAMLWNRQGNDRKMDILSSSVYLPNFMHREDSSGAIDMRICFCSSTASTWVEYYPDVCL